MVLCYNHEDQNSGPSNYGTSQWSADAYNSKTGDRARCGLAITVHKAMTQPTYPAFRECSQEPSKGVLTPVYHMYMDKPGVSHPGTNTSLVL